MKNKIPCMIFVIAVSTILSVSIIKITTKKDKE